MSGFLARWSRLKLAPAPPLPAAPEAIAPVDPASLPAFETLAAASDFAAFLQAGVAADVQTRALRVAWASDPAIAEFRGMAEYDWDFNAVGYGRLSPLDDVAAMLRALTTPAEAPLPEALPPDAPPPQTVPEAAPVVVAEASAPLLLADVPEAAVPPQAPALPAAVLPDPAAEAPRLRRHGGALPA